MAKYLIAFAFIAGVFTTTIATHLSITPPPPAIERLNSAKLKYLLYLIGKLKTQYATT